MSGHYITWKLVWEPLFFSGPPLLSINTHNKEDSCYTLNTYCVQGVSHG